MNLFLAAGVDLPASGSGKKPGAPRRPHQPLFSPKAIDRAFEKRTVRPEPDQVRLAEKYAKRARSASFRSQKEVAVRNIFFDEVLTGILGYTPVSGEGEYSLAFEYTLRRKPVDVALGRFGREDAPDQVVAPFEMKGPDTPDLDKIMPGRGVSPVQQAWDYAADAPGAQWVLVSNCLEIRLYRFGRGRELYERFDLTRLDEPGELRRLLLLLDRRRLIEGETEELLRQSDAALTEITDELYEQYSKLRGNLIGFLAESADGPKLASGKAIETAQKLLDRVIFVAFASGNGMLPGRIFFDAIGQANPFDPKPVWENVQRLFRWIDKGRSSHDPRFDVWPYNGGLFAEDPVADAVVLPDHLAQEMAKLVEWDYGREVSVYVLGHIFEQSITDLERLRGGDAPAVSRRKREGVVYTPDHITRFLVEQTLGATLRERYAALFRRHAGVEADPGGTALPWPDAETETAFWRDYLEALRELTVVDPACGSGAFLVAAFDVLAAEYGRVVGRLADLDAAPAFDVFDEILSRNLYGVDLNVESAEIARLALWLKTARRQHRLARLDHTIRAGDSLIDDPKASPRPFDWKAAFPEVFAKGGFDVVIGNPPYVRMELLKPIKPWLAQRYRVADERTDLSAYFFEKGVSLLKPGGRLGFISTSSFFRAGYGEKLRLLLGEDADIEAVVDFGDTQIFGGVTTYPAIVTLRRKERIAPPGGSLRFLKISDDATAMDLGRVFGQGAQAMPRARLTGGSWQFENDALARLRDKIVGGKKTLGEIYGAPLYGIKTGLNDAFIIDTSTRDRLVAADPRSAELLKPFLRGENIKRWRVEPEGLWLINTPRGKVRIDDYPAVRDWLLPFKDRLEARATQQEWWELQQAQLSYQSAFEKPKIVYPVISQGRKFSKDLEGSYINDKCFAVRGDDFLLASLNSTLFWFWIFGVSSALRGGMWRLELREQYMSQAPLADASSHVRNGLSSFAREATSSADGRLNAQTSFLHRVMVDLARPGTKLSRKLEDFHELSFKQFRAELKRVLKADIRPKDASDWEEMHARASAEVKRLSAEIAQAEQEIDRLVYTAFELTPDEVALLESSLKGQV